jgi:protease I
MVQKPLKNKKIALVIAFRDFKDPEYFIPRGILAASGAEIVTVSTKKGQAMGADGDQTKVDLEAFRFSPKDFSAVVFIGGAGMAKELDNEDFQKIARDSFDNGILTAAICIAPALLAKAGVLKGKEATVFSSSMQKQGIKILEENGAKYAEKNVVEDGKVITACGPIAAKEFGEALVKALSQ